MKDQLCVPSHNERKIVRVTFRSPNWTTAFAGEFFQKTKRTWHFDSPDLTNSLATEHLGKKQTELAIFSFELALSQGEVSFLS